jgi:hypothetical protein
MPNIYIYIIEAIFYVNFYCMGQTNPWFVEQKEEHNNILIQVICNVTHPI